MKSGCYELKLTTNGSRFTKIWSPGRDFIPLPRTSAECPKIDPKCPSRPEIGPVVQLCARYDKISTGGPYLRK